jgi:hypothetical protein
MQHENAMSWQHVSPFLTKRKACATYRWHTHSRWQFALNPVVSSNDMTYKTWLAYMQKKTIYIYTHTTPLIPQVAPMRLTLYGQYCICYENVFTSWERDNKIFLGPHTLGAWSWLVARQTHNPYRMIGIVLNQTSSWEDRSKIHITLREELNFLPFCRCVVTE